MKIDLKRFEYGGTYTIGKLFIDGKYQCYALEDTVRELSGSPVWAWKVSGITAIPKGKYRVIIDYSNRFKKKLPHILDVPGFEGVRIHPGNSSENTEGCILLGTTWTGGDWIGQSRVAFDAFYVKLVSALSQSLVVTLHVGDSQRDFPEAQVPSSV